MDDATGDDVRLVEITDPAAHRDLVQQVFEVVLRPSFSTDELPAADSLQRPVEHRSGAEPVAEEQTIVVAVDADGPAAALVYDRPAGSAVGVVSYLAVRPGERGRGLGGRLLARLTELVEASPVELVLAEVHDPRGHAETEDERPRARLRFYERHGARALDVPWMQPRLSPDGSRVRDMLLLVLHARHDVAGGVPSEWIVRWAEQSYLAAEHRIPDDADYRALRTRLASSGTIRVVEITDLDAIERLR